MDTDTAMDVIPEKEPGDEPTPAPEPGMESAEPGMESADEAERELFREFDRTGDPRLREELTVRHLHLVTPIVRKYRGRAEWEDLIQVGYVGLLKAVDGFDPGHLTRFSTYATHCVEGELRHYLRDRVDTIRKPRWLSSLSRRVASFIERHLHEKHRLPAFSEIASELNISEEGVVEILKARTPISIESMAGEDGRGGIAVSKIKSKRYETFRLPLEDRIVVQEAMEKLVELERKIVYLFFFRDLTQRQIADEMSLSPKKVSRVMKKALDRLRDSLTRD